MNILEKTDKYTGKTYNALNDKRVHAGQTFKLNTDTHLYFTYEPDFGWVYTPIKTYAHTEIYVDNMHLMVDVRAPEKEGFVAQPILRDISEPEFAQRILNVLSWMNKTCPQPACLENYKNAMKNAE